MTTLNKITLIFIMIVLTGYAETNVLINADFPYRVVCMPEWIEQEKNDTVLLLKNSVPGKKTRFQLQKYVVDSGFNVDNKEWSRFRYAINFELVLGFGKIGFFDTTSSKKLGGSRAFEIFAFFWEKTDDQTLWWAEYNRWTDFNGIGYMASIIGDTLDVKENVKNKNYIRFLDSISLSLMPTAVRFLQENGKTRFLIKKQDAESPFWYDFLGRDMQAAYCQQPSSIIVKKNMKRCILR